MSNGDGSDSSWGVSHLGSKPVTVTFGATLLAVLVILIVLRIAFGEIRVGVK